MQTFDIAIPKEAEALSKDALRVLNLAEKFQLTTDEDYGFASEELKRINQRHDALESLRKKLKAPIIEAGRGIDDFFKVPLALLDDALRMYKKAMITFSTTKEQKAREEQAKLEERARREREELERKAEAAMNKGKAEQAEALRLKATMTVAPIMQAAPPKVAGIGMRETWKAEVVDLRKLCAAVANGEIAQFAVEANMVFLNQQARSLQHHFNIPGCAAYPEKGISASKKG